MIPTSSVAANILLDAMRKVNYRIISKNTLKSAIAAIFGAQQKQM